MKKDSAPDFGKVAVLMGGTSAEREVSLDSGRNVLAALLRQNIDAHMLDLADADAVRRLQSKEFDRVFNILHGFGGEDGRIQALLEIFAIPYTGSGILGAALSMDKMRTKYVWQGLGLPTPEAYIIHSSAELVTYAQSLGFPLAVKPICDGSTVGVSKLESEAECEAAFNKAKLYGEVMVERWVSGAEYTVGILGEQALPVVQIIAENGFYDYHAKYLSDKTQYLCPCGLTAPQEENLKQLALQAFNALGCSAWGRVDFMFDAEQNPWLLEVNTAPGMTSHSLVPKAAKQLGLNFDELVYQILMTSIDTEQSLIADDKVNQKA